MASDSSHVAVHPARLAARREAAGSLVLLTLELPSELCRTHVLPGQYVSISAGGDAGYFVLASAVGAETWEILLRAGGDVADALLAAKPGEQVPVSAALGGGFPCDEARGRPLVIAVAGTGIAAAKPIMSWRMADGDGARTDVFLGMRIAADLPMQEEIAQWNAAGARVTVCLSRAEPPPGLAHAPGFVRGYVQDAARRALSVVNAPGSGAMIFAVGPDPMLDAVRALSRDLGVSETDFRTNY